MFSFLVGSHLWQLQPEARSCWEEIMEKMGWAGVSAMDMKFLTPSNHMFWGRRAKMHGKGKWKWCHGSTEGQFYGSFGAWLIFSDSVQLNLS